MENLKVDVQQPIKGMFKDAQPMSQPEGTYTTALNMSIYGNESNFILESEKANEPTASSLPSGYVLLGSIPMNNDSVLLISSNNTRTEIGMFKGGNYTMYINDSCLGVNNCNPVKGVFKIIKGCERVVTLYDGVNTDKYLNLDRLEDYYSEGYITYLVSNPTATPAQYETATGLSAWDCNKMELAFFNRELEVSYVATINGGKLPLGTYVVYAEGLDTDLNMVSVSNELGQMIITDDTDGGFNIEQYSAEAGGVPLVNKAIRISITNIPSPVQYLRVYVNVFRTGDGITYETFYLNQLIPVTSDIHYANIVSLDANVATRSDIAPLIVPNKFYKISNAQEIVDTRLLRANTVEQTYDWSKFQQYISKAITYYNQEEYYTGISAISGTTTEFYLDQKHFMTDEVYAINIRAIMEDGIVSPIFHVPGRMKDYGTFYRDSDDTFVDQDNADLISLGGYNIWNRNTVPAGEGWDSQLLVVETATSSNTQVLWADTKHLGVTTVTTDIGYGLNANAGNGTVGNTLIPRWLMFNTACATDYFLSNTNRQGLCGYYECQTNYPELTDCEGNDYWGTDYWGNDLTGTPIRHHRMPDLATCCPPGLTTWYYAPEVSNEAVYNNPLKLYVANVQFPPEYADKVKYWEVCIAKRDPINKTVIDKGTVNASVLYAPDEVATNNYGLSDVNTQPHLTDIFPLWNSTTLNTWGSGEYTAMRYAPAGEWFYPNAQLNIPLQTVFLEGEKPEVHSEVLIYHSPLQKIKPFAQTGYYKVEGVKSANYIAYHDNGSDERWSVFLATEKTTGQLDGSTAKWLNRNITKSVYIAPTTLQTDGMEVLSSNFTIGTTLLPINNTKIFHSYIASQLEDASYARQDETGDIIDTNGVAGALPPQTVADTYTEYVALKQVNLDCYSDLFNLDCNIVYRREYTDNYLGTFAKFTGDCFITRFAYKKLAPSGKGAVSVSSSDKFQCRGVVDGFYESEINADLRSAGSLANSFYYPKNYILVNGTFSFVLQSDNNNPYTGGIFADDNEILKRYENAAVEQFLYNNDFTQYNTIDTPSNYNQFIDYCSNCYGEFPNRLIWTPKSQEENISENWRINNANDYVDIDGSTGEIKGLFFDKNKLFVHTEDTTWFLSPNPQQIQTDQNNIYIGTGDFLSIPAIAFMRQNFGYAGSQSKFADITSVFGHTWVDAKAGKVFNFKDNLEEISARGMNNWFRDNLPFTLLNQLATISFDFCCNDSVAYDGIGLQGTYNPFTKSYILHKSDYKIINLTAFQGYKPNSNPGSVIANNLYLTSDCSFQHWNGTTWENVSFHDEDYFENKSWTISYNYITQSWISFYSYQPEWMFNDSRTLFSYHSLPLYNYIWSHDSLLFQDFYGLSWESFIETVTKNPITQTTESLAWIGKTTRFDSASQVWRDVQGTTFNKFTIYNDRQSTGLMDLNFLDETTNPFDNILYTPGQATVQKVEDNYRASEIWNWADASPVTSKTWTDLAPYFNITGNGWIDVVPKNIDLTKTQFEIDSIRGKWAWVRLIYNPSNTRDGVNLYVNSINNIESLR